MVTSDVSLYSDLLPKEEPSRPRVRLPLISQFLEQQSDLTAVERFSNRHDEGELPAARVYRDLIPLARPRPGEQYAFEVDLDACTGCKACVAACHNLNGLEPGETWRSVGLLHGGTSEQAIVQTVTTACHHCMEPACLSGCPVQAYEKDPITGIVRHLDDQCIGCQYCVFTCPFEVPRFSSKLGIVRKCDMCTDRLAEDQAPACVQGCPNEAIKIRVVSEREVVENAESQQFLPGAPAPGLTLPTTTYTTKRALPKNLLPADFYSLRPWPRHPPLVAMLVLTQLSVGALLIGLAAERWLGAPHAALDQYHALLALFTGLFALGASVLHLGRPLLSFRAVLGFRTSWLSREILAFGAFAGLALFYAASLWQAPLAALTGAEPLSESAALRLQAALRALAAGSGCIGVFCSVMVYHATRRRLWNGAPTTLRFFGSAALLGTAVTLSTAVVALAIRSDETGLRAARTLAFLLAGVTVLKLGFELSIFRHLFARPHSDLKRTALLLRGELGLQTLARFVCGVLGGVVLPLILTLTLAPGSALDARFWVVGLSLASLALSLIGELCERDAFFAAMSSARMPGGLA
jgi:formate dehydrogenase iron-sulfur subunit